MKKKDRKYYIFIVLILTTVIVFERLKPKPIDWRFTLEQKDKIPYGTYVLFNTIRDIFPKNKILTNKKTTWEFAEKDNNELKNYFYVAENFHPAKLETKTLLKLAEQGNTIFIASHRFSGKLSDTLNFNLSYSAVFDSISKINFYNQNLKRRNPFLYKKTASFLYFNKLDTTKAEILAHTENNNVVLFREPYGKGFFYFCSIPEVFTNYAMVAEKNYEFAYKTFSYLPERTLVWDEYYKPFRKANKTSLSFLLSTKSLKAAFYTLLFTLLIFVFFTAKRRQRIIPIIMPYKNKSTEFIRTIGNLYYTSKNHKDIALKRFTYLNNFLSSKYNINIIDNEMVDIKIIAVKTGIKEEQLKKLLSYHSKINKLENISVDLLISFNKVIEEIYDESK
ncbi:MAG: hypothetical protein L3J56_09735 [Bacteroidales bacterium]|nr:hypothetical protein [Bacteroidales bacterium]